MQPSARAEYGLTMPTITQKILSGGYRPCLFEQSAPRNNITASMVLNIQTNMKGLAASIQLTSEKLKMRHRAHLSPLDVFDELDDNAG